MPSRAASVSTLVVSWKEAAERKDSVASEALVIPRITGSARAGVFVFLPLNFSLIASKVSRSSSWPGSSSVEPLDSTRTFFSIWRTISSMCLSLMSTPWAR